MYSSFSHFSFRPSSRKALEALGFDTPTPVQAATLGPLLEGRDVIGQARTGSGKTLAFALPLMERIDWTESAVQALVLVPTRELAVQVAGVIEQLISQPRATPALLFGGRPFGPQVAALRSARIVVGTPGRTLDHLRQETLGLRHVRYLVLDEADEMLDRGFAPDVERIMRSAPRSAQKALFSATIADWVHEISARHLTDPLTLRVDGDRAHDDASVSELIYRMPLDQKQAVLETLLDRRGRGSVIVFGRTKHGVQKLGKRLAAKGFPVAVLQGNLSQNARDRAMADFRAGRTPILVATNVAARGIDVTDIELVINYELPENASLFTHRIGRTGRMGREGEAITLLSPTEQLQWRKIERELGRKIATENWDEPVAQRPEVQQPARVRAESPQPRGTTHAASGRAHIPVRPGATATEPTRRRWRRRSRPASA
ncbi:MAG TPA: DEAD/DEAH box helicase [Chloroflexota bacterium]|nr:DEAD/DEAH box helicase [Chloroflexota bacterium]